MIAVSGSLEDSHRLSIESEIVKISCMTCALVGVVRTLMQFI